MTRTPLLVAALLTTALAGCVGGGYNPCPPHDAARVSHETPAPIDHDANCASEYVAMGFDGATWPDLTGEKVVILDHGAFDFAFEPAEAAFENLTGADVQHVAADDAGTALQLAIQDQESGGGSFDVIYGIDNVLMSQAVDAGILEPYTPFFAARVAEEHRFVPTDDGAWLATPVDRGVIAVNIDPRSDLVIASWEDLALHADDFVTQDPRFSSPGLGFLIATVAAHGEDGYLDYWQLLFDNGVTVTSGWTEAYVDRFSGGYGQFEDGTRGDKPIVTSYTTSPAYEVYYGYDTLNDVLLAPQATFEQVQTMGILRGTENRAAAEAWIEFTLTDAFQELAAPYNAIYPVVENTDTAASVRAVYAGNDPEAETYQTADLTSQQIGEGVETWVQDWADLYDRHRA